MTARPDETEDDEGHKWCSETARWAQGPQGEVKATSAEEASAVLKANSDGVTVVLAAKGLTASNCSKLTRNLRSPIHDHPGVPCVGLPRELVPDEYPAKGKHPDGGWGVEGCARDRADGSLFAYFVKKGKAVKAMKNPRTKAFGKEVAKQLKERQTAARLGINEVPGGSALVHGIDDSPAQLDVAAEAGLRARAALPRDAGEWQVVEAITHKVAEVRKGPGGAARDVRLNPR